MSVPASAMRPLARPLLCLEGPTASGKSALAEALALELDAEIVSVDSMQVYRGMDIGTAKVPAARRAVPYHCVDVADPGTEYSAALFQKEARTAVADIDARGKTAIACGGSGLYMRALVDDLHFAAGQGRGASARRRFEELAQREGAQALHALLTERDPASAQAIHPNNVRRVVRALEMHEQGDSYARRKETFRAQPPYFPHLRLAIAVDPQVLAGRIDARVNAMLAAGLVEELEALLAQGFREAVTAPKAIGYKELVPFVDGKCSLEEAREQIQRDTRRYAKRQRTWLRSQPNVVWIDGDDGDVARMAGDAQRAYLDALAKDGRG